METAEITKGGEVRIRTSLHRTTHGLNLTVWAIPDVETFMRNLGGGEVLAVNTVGRNWVRPAGQTLYAYAMPPIPEQLYTDEGAPISLDRLGQPLLEQTGGKYESINLSFLRLQGISEGEGITFNIRGVYSLGHLKKLLERVNAATRRFYIDYVRPIDLSTSLHVNAGIPGMSTQELRL